MSIHGYVEYRPSKYAASVLRAAKAVLIEYESWESALTVRQVFYRLVAEYSYAKTESAYGSLINYIARSRRAYQRYILERVGDGLTYKEAVKQAVGTELLIPFSWIRDEKGHSVQDASYEDGDEFYDTVRTAAEEMKLDRMKGQGQYVELWCEAGSMVPLLSEIAEPYGIRVSSGGGYDSVTAKHRLAQRALNQAIDNERPTLVLHIGDFDPSGEGMFETLREDVGQMVDDFGYGEFFNVKRIALTEEQVIDWNVETAPPKRLDSRRRSFVAKHRTIREHLGSDDITAQLEALTPPDLRRLMGEAIEDVIDHDVYDEVLAEETKVREELLDRLS